MILLTILSVFVLRASAVDENVADIFVAATNSIYRMKTDGSNKTLVASAINATSLDYHHEKKLLFWSDVATHKIYSKHLFDNSSEVKTVVEGADDWEPRAIAVDFINDKIFVMDQGGKKIDVFELDGSKRVIGLIKNLTDPDQGNWNDSLGPSTFDIALDPFKGLIFYGDYNKIVRATMDASSTANIGHKSFVSAITIDRKSGSIYFAGKDRILCELEYDGTLIMPWINAYDHPSDYLRGTPMSPRSLSKFGDIFFWLDRRTNLLPGLSRLEYYFGDSVDPDLKNAWTVRVRHPSLQNKGDIELSANGCKKNKCNYMCLVSNSTYSRTEYSCFNENGERL